MRLLPTSSSILPGNKNFIAISILLFIGMVFFISFEYHAFTNSLESERKSQTQSLSLSAIGVIQYFHQLELSGEMTKSEAQQHAINALKSATYSKTGYFWINSANGELLMDPHSEHLIGKNLIDLTDANGKFIFREFNKHAKSGHNWVNYNWHKPGVEGDYPKLAYVSYFQPWDWVLGTGVYLDDMQDSIFRVVGESSGILFLVFLIYVSGLIVSINVFAQRLQDLAIRDALTKLYTKRFLFEVVPDIISKSRRLQDETLAVIFMDIDHFKQINDSYGHSIGDQVLHRLGELVSEKTRAEDYCVRFGGEEIIVIGFYDDPDEAVMVAERIRSEFAKLSFTVKKGTKFNTSLSAGIAFYDGNKETFEQTLERADQKMFESKKSGRNRVST